MQIINVGHTNFVVKVEVTRIQDLGSPPKSSLRLLTNTLHIIYKTKIAQNRIVIHINSI